MLETCTHRGLRVVALATQRLEPHVPWHKLQHLSRYLPCPTALGALPQNAPLTLSSPHRDLVVQDMDFLGLVMLQNKLKPESARILGELHHACVRPIMVTGGPGHRFLGAGRGTQMPGFPASLQALNSTSPQVTTC